METCIQRRRYSFRGNGFCFHGTRQVAMNPDEIDLTEYTVEEHGFEVIFEN